MEQRTDCRWTDRDPNSRFFHFYVESKISQNKADPANSCTSFEFTSTCLNLIKFYLFLPVFTIIRPRVGVICLCLSVSVSVPTFFTFHDGITSKRFELLS